MWEIQTVKRCPPKNSKMENRLVPERTFSQSSNPGGGVGGWVWAPKVLLGVGGGGGGFRPGQEGGPPPFVDHQSLKTLLL